MNITHLHYQTDFWKFVEDGKPFTFRSKFAKDWYPLRLSDYFRLLGGDINENEMNCTIKGMKIWFLSPYGLCAMKIFY